MSKLDMGRFGNEATPKSVKSYRVYNRFFEIAVFTALRWFFAGCRDIYLSRIYSELRVLPEDDPFHIYAPYKLEQRMSNVTTGDMTVTMIDAKSIEEMQHPEIRDLLQITDVLLGGFAHLLDRTSGKRGKCEVGNALADIAETVMDHPDGVPVVKVKDIMHGLVHTDDLLLTTPELDEEYRRSRLKGGDLLLSIRGSTGRVGIVPEALAGANITQDTARLACVGRAV